MPCPPLALFEAISARLAPLFPSYFGRRHLTQNDSPPRLVWTVAGEFGAKEWRPGLAPRSLHKDEWTFDIHCWGKDFEEAYRVRQALVTALRDVVHGANYQLAKTAAPLGDDAWLSQGEVLVVSLTLYSDLVEGDRNALADAEAMKGRPTQVDLVRPPPDWPAPGRLVSKEQ